MVYALLIYSDEQVIPAMSTDEYQAFMAEYDALNVQLNEAGAARGSVRLQTPDVATSVRMRDGEVLMTDGPFAESKEHLAGLYLVDCADLDEALSWASRIPGARIGTVEVRPVRYLAPL